MAARIAKNLLCLQQNKFRHLFRKYSSTLYMTGDKAKETFSVVTPHIDIEERLKDVESLKKNVKLRRMDHIDVDSVKSMWEVLKKIEADKRALETRRIEIAEKIKDLKASSGENEEELGKLKLHGKLTRDDLKTTVKAIWGVEKNVVPKILGLPNELNSRTPVSEAKVITHFGDVPSKPSAESHLEIGKNLNLLDYINPELYYLKGKSAIFELQALSYFASRISEANFVKFSNSDFSRSVVVEGCGVNHEDPLETFIIEDTDDLIQAMKDPNRLHLVGGASLMSFAAFHAKQIVPESALPLKLVAVGRQYKPQTRNGPGLFGACQSSSVELFISNKDDHEQVMTEFDNCVTLITNIYKDLGFPFRVVYVPAMDLNLFESLKVSFQMYSSHLQSYVEIGHLSLCDDFISKRLLLHYGTEKELKFTHVISGTAVAVPKLLACLLELFSDFDSIPLPEDLRNYLM
ncbi:Serine--tRNA synthetase-like protein Slimp [Blattella germanica]|nr:Serine--tRNA synthetase-like protein Slimp [Blattella germanica]